MQNVCITCIFTAYVVMIRRSIPHISIALWHSATLQAFSLPFFDISLFTLNRECDGDQDEYFCHKLWPGVWHRNGELNHSKQYRCSSNAHPDRRWEFLDGLDYIYISWALLPWKPCHSHILKMSSLLIVSDNKNKCVWLNFFSMYCDLPLPTSLQMICHFINALIMCMVPPG